LAGGSSWVRCTTAMPGSTSGSRTGTSGSKTPAHLLAVIKMMDDTSVATVNKHYFNIELDLMQEMVLAWERPDVPVPSSASLTVFGVEQTPICDAPLALAS
jgi:hypothetical protein